ncbi:aryl-alcohol dehydrogenase [Mycena leptocephala]|nr:aryl-alcohol dehydrogenase [Mycena leptocephala]
MWARMPRERISYPTPMSAFVPGPPPATKLGRYRQLAPRAAIHVSPLALGGMSIGDKWSKFGMGEMDKESSFKLLDAYFDAGGNHIDTANMYQDGSSEESSVNGPRLEGTETSWLSLPRHYTSLRNPRDDTIKQKNLYMGNNAKAMKLGIEDSLRRLRTTYVDIFYVHYWDLHTSVEEIMDGLHHLVAAGKVLYLGISGSPAWFIVKANEYAKANGKTPFVVCQMPYSVTQRDIEREILPMCRHEGMALTLWNVLATGHIRSDADEEQRQASGELGRHVMGPWLRTADEKKMCAALEVVAQQVGAKHITAVAIAYTLAKAPFMYPIIGGRKQIAYIEGILPFDSGFPSNYSGTYGGAYPFLLSLYAAYDPQPLVPPVSPAPAQ